MIAARAIGRRIIRLAATASTMDDATILAARGEPEGTVVLADQQTAGRGRAGRAWHAPFGSSVLCSVILRPGVPPARLSVLPLLIGVAVAESLELVADVPCHLKWPNDVLIRDEKIAGILISARTDGGAVARAIVGIGINVNVRPDDLPPGGTSLLACTGHEHDRETVLRALLERLDHVYRAFCDSNGRPDLAAWRARAAFLGDAVTVWSDGIERAGRMLGVADDGALLLEGVDGAIARIVAGDLVRGPVRKAVE